MKEKSKEENMKAPSIEQKAKAYDEALSVAQETYTTQPMYRDWLAKMFPELKENEDEKIRKELFEQITYIIPNDDEVDNEGNVLPIHQKRIDKYRAWLEKQGDNPTHINIDKMVMEYSQTKDSDFGMPVNCMIRAYRKGIIDVLNLSSGIEKQGEQNHANSTKTCEDEQKPADKVEPIDEYEGLTDFERAVADACIGFIGKELGWKQYVKDNADNLLKIAVKKFHAVQDDTTIAINNEEAYKIGFSDGEAHAKEEMTSVWSEDDEGICRAIINDIANDKSMCTFDISKGICDKKINWLKSLKDRVVCEANCTTTKQWSEDEESIINKAESWLDTLCDYLKDSSPEYISDIKDVINKLKFIKDRYTWKPSDEQMKMLENVRKILHTNKDIYSKANNLMYNFEELIRTLKKLMEE